MNEVRDAFGHRSRLALRWLGLLQQMFLGNSRGNPALPVQPGLIDTALPSAIGHVIDGRYVLVVDDNPVNLMTASALLTSFSIVPVVAADGAEAVALAAELQLELIMMDLQMPVLDGMSATRQIRQAELQMKRKRVPVVAYTTSAPSAQSLQHCGLDGKLEKPCDDRALRLCLERWCPHLLSPSNAAAHGSGQYPNAARGVQHGSSDGLFLNGP